MRDRRFRPSGRFDFGLLSRFTRRFPRFRCRLDRMAGQGRKIEQRAIVAANQELVEADAQLCPERGISFRTGQDSSSDQHLTAGINRAVRVTGASPFRGGAASFSASLPGAQLVESSALLTAAPPVGDIPETHPLAYRPGAIPAESRGNEQASRAGGNTEGRTYAN